MLLRRMMDHVKAQNWFAVVLDFVIVVLGVFLGVQLGNWNDASREHQSERAVLLQLHEEIVAAEAVFDDSRTYDPETLPGIRSFVNAFYQNEGEVTDQMICNMAGISNVMPIVIGKLSAVEELISTGRLSQLSNPDLRQVITEFHELTNLNETRIPEIRGSAVSLQRTHAELFTLDPYVAEDGEIRLRGNCDAEALKTDKVFRNILARNIDVYDAWYRRYVVQTKESLAALHAETDRSLSFVHEAVGAP